MKINRRNFLATTSLGLVSFGFSNSLLGKTFSLTKAIDSSAPSLTITQMLQQAAAKRRAGQLLQANVIYNNVLSLDPTEIRAYDGLRLVLLQAKFKELEVFQMYFNALLQNPTLAVFQERLAKEYVRLALGNKKFAEQLNEAQPLLEKAKSIFEQAKILDPLNEQIEKQFEKAKLKIAQNAEFNDARNNDLIKEQKKLNYLKFKNRYDDKLSDEVRVKLELLLAKSQDEKREKHIKQTYRSYIKNLKKEADYVKAAQKSKELYLRQKEDSISIKIARNVCRKHNKFDELENIERKNDTLKNSFWSKLSLFDVLLYRYKNENVGSISQMNTVLTAMGNKKNTFYHSFEYKVRQVRLSLVKNNIPQATTYLTQFAKTLTGTTSAHFIDKFNMLCAEYYLQQNNKNNALTVINIGLKEKMTNITDPFLLKVAEANSGKENEKEIHNKRLNDYRIKLMNMS